MRKLILVILILMVVVPCIVSISAFPDTPSLIWKQQINDPTVSGIPQENWTHVDYQNAIAAKEDFRNLYVQEIVVLALGGIAFICVGFFLLGVDIKTGLLIIIIGCSIVFASSIFGGFSKDNDADIARLRADDELARPKIIIPAYAYNETHTQRIASLNDGSVTDPTTLNAEFSLRSGLFFTLGRGQVTSSGGGTTLSYFFYKVMPGDEYMIGSIPADGVYLKEDGDSNPRIEAIFRYSMEEKKTYTDTNESVGGRLISNTTEKVTIHVPKGTVVKDFVADTR